MTSTGLFLCYGFGQNPNRSALPLRVIILLCASAAPIVHERAAAAPPAHDWKSATQCQEEVAMHSYKHIIPVTLVKYSRAR